MMTSTWTASYIPPQPTMQIHAYGKDQTFATSTSSFNEDPPRKTRNRTTATASTAIELKSVKRKAPPSSHESSDGEPEVKRNKLGYQRSTIACVNCRRRKIRCIVSTKDNSGKCVHCSRLKKDCNFEHVDQSVTRGRNRREIRRNDAQSLNNNLGLARSMHNRKGSTYTAIESVADLQPYLLPAMPSSSATETLSFASYAYSSPPLSETSTYMTANTIQDTLGLGFGQTFDLPPLSSSTSAPSYYGPTTWSYGAPQIMMEQNYNTDAFNTITTNTLARNSISEIPKSMAQTETPAYQSITIKEAILTGDLPPTPMTSTVTGNLSKFLSPSLPAEYPVPSTQQSSTSVHRSQSISFPIDPPLLTLQEQRFLSPTTSDFMSAVFFDPLPSISLPGSGTTYLSPPISEPPMPSTTFTSSSFFEPSINEQTMQSYQRQFQELPTPTGASSSPFPWTSPFTPGVAESQIQVPGWRSTHTALEMTPAKESTLSKFVKEQQQQGKWYE